MDIFFTHIDFILWLIMNEPRFECNRHAERVFPLLQISKTVLDLMKLRTFYFS